MDDGGGVYHPVLRRLETFTDEPLRTAVKDHEKRAALVLDLEEKVAAAVAKLKERGLVSPYLRAFVVARVNPLRWIKDEPPPLEDVLKTMRDRAGRFRLSWKRSASRRIAQASAVASSERRIARLPSSVRSKRNCISPPVNLTRRTLTSPRFSTSSRAD